MAEGPSRASRRALVAGAFLGVCFYAGALALHGGVRAERGCVVDTPVYEIVNGPVMVLAKVGLPIAPEGVGEMPPVGWVPPAAPPFRKSVLFALGFGCWGLLGAGAAFGLVSLLRRRGRGNE